MEKEKVIAIKVEKRPQTSVKLQQALAEHGKLIDARLGLHKSRKGRDQGLVILCARGKEDELASLSRNLRSIQGIIVKSITL